MDNFVQPTTDASDISDEELKAILEGMSKEEVLAIFAKGLLIEKGFTDLDADTEADMINDLVQRLVFFVNESIVEALPEDKQKELEVLTDSESVTDEKMDEIIRSAGIDIDGVTRGAMEKFREIYLGGGEDTEA